MPCFFLHAVGMARILFFSKLSRKKVVFFFLGLTQVDAAQLSGVSPRRERALGRRYDARRNCATCSTVMLAYDFHAGRGPIWMTTSMSSALRNRPRRS